MQNKDSVRIEWIDALKGIGIIIMMFSHSCGIPVGKVYFNAFYIPMFFIVAGLNLDVTRIKGSPLGYMKHKAKRLVLPYMVYGSIIVVGISFIEILFHKAQWPDLLRRCIGLVYSRYSLFFAGDNRILLLDCGNAAMWFLTAMFSAYFFVYIYFRISKKYWKAAVLAVYFTLSVLLQRLPILLPWSLDTAMVGAMLMIAGHSLAGMGMKEEKGVKRRIIELVVCLALYILCASLNGVGNMSVRTYGDLASPLNVLMFMASGIFGTIATACVLRLIGGIGLNAVFALIGKCSMVIMCTHLVVFRMIDFAGLEDKFNPYLYGCIKIAVAAVVGVVIYKFVRRYLPKMRFLT